MTNIFYKILTEDAINADIFEIGYNMKVKITVPGNNEGLKIAAKNLRLTFKEDVPLEIFMEFTDQTYSKDEKLGPNRITQLTDYNTALKIVTNSIINQANKKNLVAEVLEKDPIFQKQIPKLTKLLMFIWKSSHEGENAEKLFKFI